MNDSTETRTLPIVPASFFGIVLGLAGLAGNWRAAHVVWGLPIAMGEALYVAAFLAWAAITVLYVLKWTVVRRSAIEEAGHSIQCCFIGLAGAEGPR